MTITDPDAVRRAFRGDHDALASVGEAAFDSVRELQERNRQLRAEREFLLGALEERSDFGLSAKNMVLSALTGRTLHPRHYPRDRGDWGRCERTYEIAPAHLKPKLKAIMDGWREVGR